jgi:hypothetical protein
VYHPGSGHADLRDVIAVRRDLGRVVVTLDTGREISWAGSTQVNVAVKGRSRRTRVDLDTTKRTLPPGTVLIKGEEGYPRTFATIYAHPDLLQSLSLAAPAAPLSDVEGKVLNIYGGIKSGYRQDELRRKDISPQAAAAAVRSLIAAGYLAQNKAGAVSITTAGKNARPSGYYRRRPSALQVELARRSRQARQQPRHRDGRFSKRRR